MLYALCYILGALSVLFALFVYAKIQINKRKEIK